MTKSGCGADALTPLPFTASSSTEILVTILRHVNKLSVAGVGPIVPVPICGPDVLMPLVLGV